MRHPSTYVLKVSENQILKKKKNFQYNNSILESGFWQPKPTYNGLNHNLLHFRRHLYILTTGSLMDKGREVNEMWYRKNEKTVGKVVIWTPVKDWYVTERCMYMVYCSECIKQCAYNSISSVKSRLDPHLFELVSISRVSEWNGRLHSDCMVITRRHKLHWLCRTPSNTIHCILMSFQSLQ